MNKMKKILIVEDETDIRELVAFHLEKEGFSALQASTGEAGLSMLWDENIDLVILDLMMPGVNGLEVLKAIRDNKRTMRLPVILLTAKATEVDKIIGFQLGTDDYVCKPFSVKELMVRIKALLRRTGGFTDESGFSVEGFSINFNSHKIFVDGRSVDFSPKEFGLFEYLYRNKNIVVGRGQLLDKVWGMDASVDERVVDVNITRLREKMDRAKKLIKTVKGYGYMFDTSEIDSETVKGGDAQ